MYFNEQLSISDSLFRLIKERQRESDCLRVLFRALQNATGQRRGSAFRSRLLNPVLPGNYFSFRETVGMISFMPTGRTQTVTADGTWRREGRQSVKPAKWIRSMLHPRIARRLKDHQFSVFNSIIKHEELRTKLTFKKVSVRQGYNADNFASFESCMWNEPVEEFYEAFGCKVLVAHNQADDKWLGRALIWPEVKAEGHEDLVTYMDRIYCISIEVQLAFKAYATEMGWCRKRDQSRELSGFTRPDGTDCFNDITVFTDQCLDDLDFYPYLDTFAYGGHDRLSTGKTGHIYVYRNTNGSRDGDDHEGQVLDAFGEWIDEDDAVSIDGDWYHADSDAIVQCYVTEEYILRKNSYFIDLSRMREDSFYISSRFVRRGA
jgi:hypothetical protein